MLLKKENQYSNSLVTVITVSYNAHSTIEQTILSVIGQTYSNIEYIIIDGGSTDGTLDVIKKYANKISYWISEPDKGIYDAMNKGIDLAKGLWINFMNSGDIFFDKNVISNIMKCDLRLYHVVYGKTIVNYNWGKYIVLPNKISLLEKCMPFCHQSTFVRTEDLKDYKFNLECKISADYNFFFILYKKMPNVFFYYEDIVAIYDSIYGFSSNNVSTLSKEACGIAGIEYSFQKKVKNYFLIHAPVFFLHAIMRIYFFINKRYSFIR